MSQPGVVSSPAHGVPLVYEVLGAYFQLEEIEPEDADRISAFNDKVLSWFGPELKWSMVSGICEVEPFHASDLEYAACYPEELEVPAPDDNPDLNDLGLLFGAETHQECGVASHNGLERMHAGPFSYRFYADVTRVEYQRPTYPARAILRITVPSSWPSDDFKSRFCDLADTLRLRWASAGYTYSAWEVQHYEQARAAIYAHARRHWGFDVNEYVSFVDEWYEQVRSINWLTVVGPGLLSKLPSQPVSGREVTVSPLSSGILLEAGPTPQYGDINRLVVPSAYVEADSMIRPIRAASGIDLLAPWDGTTTEDWLRRFERQGRPARGTDAGRVAKRASSGGSKRRWLARRSS